ncbi:MAG TPA: hypothetical protein DEO37_05285 [Aerococcaceae bacterium]|nr:hypothetical protein [Aerococcaceae bacterium]
MNKLQFSRQYVVEDRYIEEFEGWNKLEIGKKFVATIHPDLEFSQIINEHHTITLLGYLINPYKSNMSNKEIIKEISQNISNFEDLIEETYCLSGRWVLIYQSGNIIRRIVVCDKF